MRRAITVPDAVADNDRKIDDDGVKQIGKSFPTMLMVLSLVLLVFQGCFFRFPVFHFGKL